MIPRATTTTSNICLEVRPAVCICLQGASQRAVQNALRRYSLANAAHFGPSITVRFDGAQSAPPQVEWEHLGERCVVTVEPEFADWDWLEKLAELHRFCQGALPLHASSAIFKHLGIVLVGDAHSGKTAALLALLDQGADFVSDDGVIVQQSGKAISTSSSLDLRLPYWQGRPEFRRHVPAARQVYCKLLSYLVGVTRPFPFAMARRLTRAAERRQRVTFNSEQLLSNGRCQKNCNADVLVMVTATRNDDCHVTQLVAAPFARQVVAIQRKHFAKLLHAYASDAGADRRRTNQQLADFDSLVYQRAEALAMHGRVYQLAVPAGASLERLHEPIAAWCSQLTLETSQELANAM